MELALSYCHLLIILLLYLGLNGIYQIQGFAVPPLDNDKSVKLFINFSSEECHLLEDFKRVPMRTKRSPLTKTTGDVDILHKMKRRLKSTENRLTTLLKQFADASLTSLSRLEGKVIGKGSMNLGVHMCPSGFHHVSKTESCYMMSNFNTTWYEARDFCSAMGSELVSLNTVMEHYAVAFLIKNSPDHAQIPGWWTSGTFLAHSLQWMWMSEVYMQPFSFIKWAPMEPNEETLQCVFMSRDHGHLWADDPCMATYNFVCEIRLPKPNEN